VEKSLKNVISANVDVVMIVVFVQNVRNDCNDVE